MNVSSATGAIDCGGRGRGRGRGWEKQWVRGHGIFIIYNSPRQISPALLGETAVLSHYSHDFRLVARFLFILPSAFDVVFILRFAK